MTDEAQAGARVRAMRLERGMTQAALARDAGISASYLNLIEHGRRRVGARLLGELAGALDVDAARLAEGVAAETLGALGRAAQRMGDVGAEVDRAERFAGDYPGWAALVAAQEARIAALEGQVAAMGERMAHDPGLAASVHEVLSTVTAIRSTAAILVEGEVEEQWRGRFHRNMHEEAQRLAESAQTLSRYLSAGQTETGARAPHEEVEAWLAARGGRVPELEDGRRPDPPPEMTEGGRAALARWLDRAEADAAACPAGALHAAVRAAGPDPATIAGRLGVGVGVVLRRLAAVGEEPMGLVECDGSGALITRRAVTGFEVPRYSPACALWPVFQALMTPFATRTDTLRQYGAATRPMTAHTAVEVTRPGGPTAPLAVRATMLLVPGGDAGTEPLHVGVTCRLCPAEECPARREPSLL